MINKFNLDFLVLTIEELCRQRKMSVKSALEDCGLKRVVVDNMKKGSVPSIDKIFTLANYFGVSVDYLLGRTDEPQPVGGEFTKTADKETIEIAEMIKDLPLIERSKVVLFIEQLSKQKKQSLQRPNIRLSQSQEKAFARNKEHPLCEAPTPEQRASLTPVPEDSGL